MTTSTTPPTSSLCDMPITPQFITGYLINFCKWKFSRKENILNEYLREDHYLWRPDNYQNEEMTKGIMIRSAYDWSPNDAQQRPAILIKRASTDTGRMTIGDKYHTPTNLIGDGHNPNYEATTGQNQQLVSISGAHQVFSLGNTGGAAENLGIELWQTFIDYKYVIRRDLKLDRIDIGTLSATGQLREAKGAWVAPFVVNYNYQRSTLIRQESPLLKRVTVKTTIQ